MWSKSWFMLTRAYSGRLDMQHFIQTRFTCIKNNFSIKSFCAYILNSITNKKIQKWLIWKDKIQMVRITETSVFNPSMSYSF